MRCRTCDYLLWNSRERRCPECGTPCLPSEYEFVANSVAFCCPHCDQAYYGTGPKGHVNPQEFDCVSCGRHIHMDEMVLRPAEGVDDDETEAERVPWLERNRRGRIRAWFSTVGMALVAPVRLMQGHTGTSRIGQAWWFAIVTSILLGLGIAALFLPFFVLPMVLPPVAGPGGPGAGFVVLGVFGGFVGVLAGVVLVVVVGIALWGLVSHGLL